MGKSRGFDITIVKAERILQNTIGCYIAPIDVRIAPIDHRRAVRTAFNKVIKERFRESVAEVFGRKVQHNKTIHHIKPIFLGGTNAPHNLVFLPERIHTACHVLIDYQITNMRPSETRTIRLPFFNVQLVPRV